MRFDGRLAFRGFAAILIAGAVLHVVTLWPRVIRLAEALPAGTWLLVAGYAVSALTALLACALAVLLLWKAADRAEARALTLFLGFLAVFWGSLFRFLDVEGDSSSVSANLSYGDGWISSSAAMAFVLAVAAFARFSALFPRPLRADDLPPPRRFHELRRARVALLHAPVVWGLAIASLVLLELAPWLVSRFVPPLPDGTAARSVIAAALTVSLLTYVVLPVGAFIFGTRNLRASYRIATTDERRRILWVVSGFTIAAWMIVGAAALLLAMATLDIGLDALGAAIPLALFLAPFVVVTFAAVGILRSGALDPALVLQRSTVYGALGVLAVVTFAGLENALSAWVEDRLSLPGFIGSMVAGALVATALLPLRKPLQRLVLKRARAEG